MSPSSNKAVAPATNNLTPYKEPKPTPPKRRESIFWYQTVNHCTKSKYSSQEVEKQEAIYELYKSELDMIEDLQMVKTVSISDSCVQNS